MNEAVIHLFPDQLDHQIIMHRDAHFGSNFEIMIEYYKQGGKGATLISFLHRIEELACLEKQKGLILREFILTSTEQRLVQEARQCYLTLRQVYEQNLSSSLPHLIADLILSEEKLPTEEMNALVTLKEKAIGALEQLEQSTRFLNPLFPGYGKAPMHACRCLMLIKEEIKGESK